MTDEARKRANSIKSLQRKIARAQVRGEKFPVDYTQEPGWIGPPSKIVPPSSSELNEYYKAFWSMPERLRDDFFRQQQELRRSEAALSRAAKERTKDAADKRRADGRQNRKECIDHARALREKHPGLTKPEVLYRVAKIVRSTPERVSNNLKGSGLFPRGRPRKVYQD